MYQPKRDSVLRREAEEVEGQYAALTVLGSVAGLVIAMLIWSIANAI